MTTTIRVLHNNNPRDGMVFGFQPAPYRFGDTAQPAHTVTEVFSYTALPDDPYPVEFAYDLCNVGDDPTFFDTPDPRAVEYRDRGNRSLSVGDVVAVHDNRGAHGSRWYACAHTGFDLLDQAPVIENAERHGTTPIDAPLVVYVVTFSGPRELERQRWAIEAYAHHQLTRRIQQRLTAQLELGQVRLRFTSNHAGFALSSVGAEVAEFTAVPVPDAAEFSRYKPRQSPGRNRGTR